MSPAAGTDPVVVAYDPAWPAAFAAAAAELEAALAGVLVGPIEHIGSTAVPGMAAKPIIDMMGPVAAVSDVPPGVLAPLGYTVRPHRLDAVLFVRPPTHGVHLTTIGSDLWRERLAFRDALRGDAALRAEYHALKQRLLAASGGAVYDSADKRDFVRRVLAGTGHPLREGLHDPAR